MTGPRPGHRGQGLPTPLRALAAACLLVSGLRCLGTADAGGLKIPPANAPAAAYGPAVRSGHGHPDADDLAGLAARLREQGDLAPALHLSTRVRGFSPGNVQAIQTEVSTLSNLGAARRAWQLARAHSSVFARADLDRLRADKVAADIRDALSERRRLERRFEYARRNEPLSAVLPELDAELAAFPAGSVARRRALRDRLFLLDQLGRSREAVTAWQGLRSEGGAQPPYVRAAAAHALYVRHHPHQAAALYAGIIEDDPGVDVDVFIGRYYALLDGEDYGDAGKLLARIARDTPVWLHRPGPHPGRSPNWERVEVDRLRVLDAAYRNRQAAAERRAWLLSVQAPFNTDLINTCATVLRWRGWPRRAAQETALAVAYAPRDKATRLNLADDARDLGQYDRWHAAIVPLAREFPHDTTVRDSLAAWDDRGRPSMSARLEVGRSHGNNVVSGTRDRELLLRLNSPWNAAGWRAFATHDYRWAAYDAGAASFNRVGVGAEWRWGRRHAWGRVSDRQLSGEHTGVQIGWSQWLGDYWHYLVSGDTHSVETPLRAERAGLRGRLLRGQLTWRASESRSASAGLDLLDISDGNLRQSWSADYSQRLQASAHHLTRAGVSLGYDRNSRPGGPYFNPANLVSAGLSVHHDWVTWRRYRHSLTQKFDLVLAAEHQSGYGSAAAGYELRYGHTWALSRTWTLDYALGWGSHVYDGAREYRLFGAFGISGVF